MTPEEKLFNRVKIAFVKARIPKPMTTAKSLMAQIQPSVIREQAIDSLLQKDSVEDIVVGFADWGRDTIEEGKFWIIISNVLRSKNL